METRSERRARGSALVASTIKPSQPSPAALRTMAPMLAGLSTASTRIRRRAVAASSSTELRGGRSKIATTVFGTPSLVTCARTASPPE